MKPNLLESFHNQGWLFLPPPPDSGTLALRVWSTVKSSKRSELIQSGLGLASTEPWCVLNQVWKLSTVIAVCWAKDFGLSFTSLHVSSFIMGGKAFLCFGQQAALLRISLASTQEPGAVRNELYTLIHNKMLWEPVWYRTHDIVDQSVENNHYRTLWYNFSAKYQSVLCWRGYVGAGKKPEMFRTGAHQE